MSFRAGCTNMSYWLHTTRCIQCLIEVKCYSVTFCQSRSQIELVKLLTPWWCRMWLMLILPVHSTVNACTFQTRTLLIACLTMCICVCVCICIHCLRIFAIVQVFCLYMYTVKNIRISVDVWIRIFFTVYLNMLTGFRWRLFFCVIFSHVVHWFMMMIKYGKKWWLYTVLSQQILNSLILIYLRVQQCCSILYSLLRFTRRSSTVHICTLDSRSWSCISASVRNAFISRRFIFTSLLL